MVEPPGVVRLVVLNHDGGDDLRRCVAAMAALDWPAGQLELVVVDNASTDDSLVAVERDFPQVRVVRTGANLGFPANNLALQDLTGVRYVGLVNNDAFVDPGWLAPLVAALDDDPGLGAVNGTMVFDARFVDLHVAVVAGEDAIGGPGSSRRPRPDDGVCLHGLRVDGADAWPAAHLVEGGWGPEPGLAGGVVEWTRGSARVRVPVVAQPSATGDEDRPGSWTVAVELAATEPRGVRLDGGAGPVEVRVGPRPTWVTVPVAGRPYDVVNNAGSAVLANGYGVDRGYLVAEAEWASPAPGAAAGPTEVFAWCGGDVLLRPDYLHQVGLFEPGYFLYYEDVDLSWRGRRLGWRYACVAEARARHRHAASTGVASATATHYAERNRLLTLVRNAPASMAAVATARFVTATASYAWRDRRTVSPRANPLVARRVDAYVDYLRHLPRAVVQRRRLRAVGTVPDAEIRAWLVPGARARDR